MRDSDMAGETALTRAVRALDQGDFETIPDRLERVWDTLQHCHGRSFHAAEEMLLRWLLKNMGSSANAERLRRLPQAWNILGAVFALIPLFSLAKSLADRRFVGILQQTLKDVATPQQEGAQPNGTESDVEMADASPQESPANPRKRKRSNVSNLDITVQKQLGGCLQTAEAVFNAVRVLLSRCELRSLDEPALHRMGAEHVKSLFSSSASEAMEILVPWLTICRLAADRPKPEPFTEQSSWLSTFGALWELHLQSAGDASEVATHLSATGTRLLGRLTGIPRQMSLGINPQVQERWARDLRRFLARNLILPARAAFLTRGSQEVIQVAVDMSSASAPTTFPVLFDLVSRSPREFGPKTSRKDYETWVQAVFDAILHASKNINREDSLAAVRAIMEMAAERGAVLSASSLRAVCKSYALRPNMDDWSLLLSTVKLNPDVFLVSEDGKQLLEQVLERTLQPDALSAEDFERAAQFIVLLADGYAQARDLSTFVKVWLKHLAPVKPKAGLQPLWAQRQLVDTVARLIQSSLNTNQLVEVLGWLSSQTQPTESMARIYILQAISSGISQEDFIDAANMNIFDGVFLEKFSKKELPSISACRWTVTANTIARGTLEEFSRIWLQIKADLKSILRKLPIGREDTLAAFKCCVAAWLANHPGAAYEEEAATLICSFVDRLEKDGESMELDSDNGGASVSTGTYISWMLSDAPRLLSLFMERKGCVPNAILTLISRTGAEAARLDSALAASRLLLERESNINNQKLMDSLINIVISLIDAPEAPRAGPSTKIGVQFLLDVPTEALSRAQREAAMKALVSRLPQDPDRPEDVGFEYWRPVLSLMVKLMGRPTFYEGMSFSHLDLIGRCLLKIHQGSSRPPKDRLTPDVVSDERDSFQLLLQLAVLTLRQMTSGNIEGRERRYLTGAISLLQSPYQDSDVIARIILLQAFVSAVQSSPAARKLEGDILDLNGLWRSLLQIASPVVTSPKWYGQELLALLVALEALGSLDRETVRQSLSDAVPSLLDASDSLLAQGVQAGWEIRMFLANHFPEALRPPLKLKVSVDRSASAEGDGDVEGGFSALTLGKAALLRYVDAVVRAADEDTKLGYLEELLLDECDVQELLVIYRLVQHLKGSRPSDSPDKFGLSQAHSTLCNRLMRASIPARFVLTSKAIHLLLDQSPACMTQWNIELTLSSVSTISAQAPTRSLVSSSPIIYESLCRLVEIVIKRHRKRLDGHFHILITALQSLLRLLLSWPYENSNSNSDNNPTSLNSSPGPTTTRHSSSSPSFSPPPWEWEKHAKRFARLLTLVCEPTAASVAQSSSRSGGGGALLDSDKDRAKRYAGQHMYLVLMQYVRLQLEYVVPHGVREALEPGVYAVMDVTTREGLRLMNDALDPSGRVIFKEMYKQYQKFGKWTGV
ncbi:hypothetical protein VTK56DRAFT_4044 [Thermocarpiscus australiensis]